MNHINWGIVASYGRGIWTAAGPLVGVLVGALLGRSWDRRKWLNDNRKEEYRELITVLTDATAAVIERVQSNEGSHLIAVRDCADFRAQKEERYLKAVKTLEDRIFIAGEIQEIHLFDRWTEAVKKALESRSVSAVEDVWQVLKREIVKRATTL